MFSIFAKHASMLTLWYSMSLAIPYAHGSHWLALIFFKSDVLLRPVCAAGALQVSQLSFTWSDPLHGVKAQGRGEERGERGGGCGLVSTPCL